jgi:hypothetical protein
VPHIPDKVQEKGSETNQASGKEIKRNLLQGIGQVQPIGVHGLHQLGMFFGTGRFDETLPYPSHFLNIVMLIVHQLGQVRFVTGGIDLSL